MLRSIRRRLIEGLIVLVPVGVTAYILWWIFRRLDGLLGNYLYDVIGFRIPGLGIVLLLGGLLLVGWAAERAVGARVLDWWQELLHRVPVVRRFYGTSSRIVKTVLGHQQHFFREVVLFEYPFEGRWAVGFVTDPDPESFRDVVQDAVTVFLPTAPNPTSGFLIVVPRSKIISLPMTVEEGFTFVLSAGSVTPQTPAPAAAETREERI